MNKAVLIEIQDSIAIITLNRPDRYNSVNQDLLDGFNESFSIVENDDSIRAVVLTGNGKGFCAGADMSVFRDEVTAEQRRYAKVINFGLIYGMGVYGLAKNLNIERAAAQNYIERYFSKYPSVRQYMEFTKEAARRNGYIETFFGRKLWVPDINGSNGMRRAAAERAAINGPMQGTAADLIKMAMVGVADWIKKEDALKGKMIMQVHDELVFEIQADKSKEYAENLRIMMSDALKLSIPLVVDVGIGSNWQEAH